MTLDGADAGNYTLTQPTIAADITTKSLTVSATADDKVYDSTTAATAHLTTDALSGDDIIASGVANFDTADAGTSKTVTVSGITLSGADASNYQPNDTTTATASITQAANTITFGPLVNKTTSDAPFTVSASASSQPTSCFQYRVWSSNY